MNKNNLIVKFAHFYVENFKEVAENASEIWDLLCEFLAKLLEIIANFLMIIMRVFLFFIPVLQMIAAKETEYLTLTDEDKEILNPEIKEGYWFKSAVREIRKEIKEYKDKLLSEQKDKGNNREE